MHYPRPPRPHPLAGIQLTGALVIPYHEVLAKALDAGHLQIRRGGLPYQETKCLT